MSKRKAKTLDLVRLGSKVIFDLTLIHFSSLINWAYRFGAILRILLFYDRANK